MCGRQPKNTTAMLDEEGADAEQRREGAKWKKGRRGDLSGLMVLESCVVVVRTPANHLSGEIPSGIPKSPIRRNADCAPSPTAPSVSSTDCWRFRTDFIPAGPTPDGYASTARAPGRLLVCWLPF